MIFHQQDKATAPELIGLPAIKYHLFFHLDVY